jgi:hypothetical protein
MGAILQHTSDSPGDVIHADRRLASSRLAEFVRSSVDQARSVEEPFFHVEFDRVFPSDVYKAMLASMPSPSDYRPMSGRVKTSGENPTRVKIDLFPEYLRHMRAAKRQIWEVVGRALCSQVVKESLIRRLAPGLSRRFGPQYANVGFYPVPILTRDIRGYSISPHTDTSWKGITVQFYLPPDESAPHLGTVFHSKHPNGSLIRRTQMRFAPNTGYAFAVADDTWHSVDEVGREVHTRDSILLTYFLDTGLLRSLRNRGRRVGNFLRNEVRHVRRSG